MVVLIIIAIFAALAVPQLVEVHRRNKLTDLTNMVEQSAAQVRTLAMQTRRAVVFEVADSQVWINTLQGSDCWSRINTRCMHNVGEVATTSFTNVFDMQEEHFIESGAYHCGTEIATIADGACAQNVVVGPGDAFALCYSGKGDLYARISEDATTCEPGQGIPGLDIGDQDDWVRSCVVTDSTLMPFNGAVLKFNRFESAPADCSATSLGVTRGVHVPVGAAPFSRVEI
jgi:type II secretory pathway pseudopilin PulG